MASGKAALHHLLHLDDGDFFHRAVPLRAKQAMTRLEEARADPTRDARPRWLRNEAPRYGVVEGFELPRFSMLEDEACANEFTQLAIVAAQLFGERAAFALTHHEVAQRDCSSG